MPNYNVTGGGAFEGGRIPLGRSLFVRMSFCRQNSIFPIKMEGFPLIPRPCSGTVETRLIASVHKNGRENRPYGAFLRPRRAFLCGKNGISLLKEICFLPQRREFLAAKTFPGVWKAGKNGASGGVFLLVGGFPRAKSICPFASLSPHGPTRGRRPSARHPVAGGKVSRKTGLRLSSCIPAGPRDSRISARARPCARPRDSRGAGFDVLTKWYVGTSAACRASGPPGRGKKISRLCPEAGYKNTKTKLNF